MDKVSKTTNGFEALWVPSLIVLSFLSCKTRKKIYSQHIFLLKQLQAFSKRENKRSASVDVGIWDKEICIFDFLYSEFLITQFKKDSLNTRDLFCL